MALAVSSLSYATSKFAHCVDTNTNMHHHGLIMTRAYCDPNANNFAAAAPAESAIRVSRDQHDVGAVDLECMDDLRSSSSHPRLCSTMSFDPTKRNLEPLKL